jgi:hypothetical protein
VSTTSIRWTVAKQLVTLLTAHASLAGTQVEPGWPGDSQKAESIWIESLDGTEEVPYMNGGARITTDDRFEIPLQIRVANRSNLNDTMERLTEIVAAVQDVVKNNPSLGITPANGMMETDLGQTDMTAGRMPEGCLGFARITLSVYSRLF